jgi:hypothetical protein
MVKVRYCLPTVFDSFVPTSSSLNKKPQLQMIQWIMHEHFSEIKEIRDWLDEQGLTEKDYKPDFEWQRDMASYNIRSAIIFQFPNEEFATLFRLRFK